MRRTALNAGGRRRVAGVTRAERRPGGGRGSVQRPWKQRRPPDVPQSHPVIFRMRANHRADGAPRAAGRVFAASSGVVLCSRPNTGDAATAASAARAPSAIGGARLADALRDADARQRRARISARARFSRPFRRKLLIIERVPRTGRDPSSQASPTSASPRRSTPGAPSHLRHTYAYVRLATPASVAGVQRQSMTNVPPVLPLRSPPCDIAAPANRIWRSNVYCGQCTSPDPRLRPASVRGPRCRHVQQAYRPSLTGAHPLLFLPLLRCYL